MEHMMTISVPLDKAPSPALHMPAWLTILLAAACGMIAANLFYAQPLIGMISTSLGMSPQIAGLIVTVTQLGFAAGLIFLVPLADLVENRNLTVGMLALMVLALVAASVTTMAKGFLAAMFFIGMGTVAAQILIPYASLMAPDAVRGRTVGNVMSGLMLGIMLSRPLSSLLASTGSWHAVFAVSAIAMSILAIALRFVLPVRKPHGKITYFGLLASMWTLMRSTPILQRRAIYQSFQFAAFTLFWTVTPLVLTGPQFHLSQVGVALFALAGVAGAIAAPIAGRMADRGLSKPATAMGMLAVGVAFLITHIAPAGSTLALGLLVVAAITLDFGITTTLVTGQRAIFTLGAEIRGRVNALYMTTWYLAGAIASATGAWAYSQGGWDLTSWIGFSLPIGALACFATEK